tara:strand:+ start:518 stop:727 length:210 start_codon:yes stop_codon:yes gene_type:complete
MTKPTIQIHNIESGEIIEREMNAEELAKYKEIQKTDAELKKDIEDKTIQKQALLDKLGITAEEAALLLS